MSFLEKCFKNRFLMIVGYELLLVLMKDFRAEE